MLKKSEFYKQGFRHSPPDTKRTAMHFPMILTDLPFDILYNEKRVVIALFTHQDINFLVVNVHLTAYESKRQTRKEEMRYIDTTIKELVEKTKDKSLKDRIKDALINKNLLLLGDLNLHFPGESKLLDRHMLIDLWLEKHSHFDGLTWDTERNSMTKWMLPFDNRRMRLDRITMRQSKQLDLCDISMVFTQGLNRICLFPSDHFGIMADI